MNEFKTYHPIVNFTYFTTVILFSMFLMNPVCLVISLISGFLYSVILNGKKAVKFNLLYMLPMLVFAAFLNPAFNHEGITILTYLPSGNPLTLESIVYGLCAAIMIACVVCWFSCCNAVMTSDKFIYLFGKIIPSMSLILSMTLRFVPKFKNQIKTVTNAQKCIDKDPFKGKLITRIKNATRIISIMITWSLENAIETSDSMNSRGYGLPERTAFSIFQFDKRDAKALSCILVSSLYVLYGVMGNKLYYRYFPSIKFSEISLYNITLYIAYLLLCIMPVIIELWEEQKWKAIQSKI